MKIQDILTPAPKCVGPDSSIQQAAQEMKALDIGLLPVCDNDRLVGMITDRDIAVRAVAAGLTPQETTVRQVMTDDVIYCFEDQDIKDAARTMEEQQIRRLPVLNRSKRLVGIVSLGDLVVRTGKEKLAGEVLERVSEPAADAART